MRMLFLAAVGAAALWSLPAEASHRHYFFGPYVGFGYYPYSWYSPWYYGPAFGVGSGNSVTSPRGVMRPTWWAVFSQNQ